MVREPRWMPGLPLAVEIGEGDNYGESNETPFVKVNLQEDGSVILWDDGRREFHLEMRRGLCLALMSRKAAGRTVRRKNSRASQT